STVRGAHPTLPCRLSFAPVGRPRVPPSFPTRALPISGAGTGAVVVAGAGACAAPEFRAVSANSTIAAVASPSPAITTKRAPHGEDRKNTRLNSSHVSNSYAVFCLKKKIYRTRKELQQA